VKNTNYGRVLPPIEPHDAFHKIPVGDAREISEMEWLEVALSDEERENAPTQPMPL